MSDIAAGADPLEDALVSWLLEARAHVWSVALDAGIDSSITRTETRIEFSPGGWGDYSERVLCSPTSGSLNSWPDALISGVKTCGRVDRLSERLRTDMEIADIHSGLGDGR